MRADGSTQLHIHAQLETEDGHSIAYFADGVALPEEGTSKLLLRENVSLITASPSYAWLNELQGMGHGAIDPGNGEIAVVVHAA